MIHRMIAGVVGGGGCRRLAWFVCFVMDPRFIILMIRRLAKEPTDDLRGCSCGRTVAGVWRGEGGDEDLHRLLRF